MGGSTIKLSNFELRIFSVSLSERRMLTSIRRIYSFHFKMLSEINIIRIPLPGALSNNVCSTVCTWTTHVYSIRDIRLRFVGYLLSSPTSIIHRCSRVYCSGMVLRSGEVLRGYRVHDGISA